MSASCFRSELNEYLQDKHLKRANISPGPAKSRTDTSERHMQPHRKQQNT